jgi:hypothetical protein
LNLLARHGVNRAEFGGGRGAPATDSVFLDLFAQCSEWQQPISRQGPTMAGSIDEQAHRHLKVISQLQARRFARHAKNRLQSVLTAPDQLRLSDVYFAWRAARTVSRP